MADYPSQFSELLPTSMHRAADIGELDSAFAQLPSFVGKYGGVGGRRKTRRSMSGGGLQEADLVEGASFYEYDETAPIQITKYTIKQVNPDEIIANALETDLAHVDRTFDKQEISNSEDYDLQLASLLSLHPGATYIGMNNGGVGGRRKTRGRRHGRKAHRKGHRGGGFGYTPGSPNAPNYMILSPAEEPKAFLNPQWYTENMVVPSFQGPVNAFAQQSYNNQFNYAQRAGSRRRHRKGRKDRKSRKARKGHKGSRKH